MLHVIDDKKQRGGLTWGPKHTRDKRKKKDRHGKTRRIRKSKLRNRNTHQERYGSRQVATFNETRMR
jgi:hypothetical protein